MNISTYYNFIIADNTFVPLVDWVKVTTSKLCQVKRQKVLQQLRELKGIDYFESIIRRFRLKRGDGRTCEKGPLF